MFLFIIKRYMDKKYNYIYDMKYSQNQDKFNCDISFQNMMYSQNNMFPNIVMPNISISNSNYLSKKREAQEQLTNNIRPKNRCKSL